MMWPAWTVHSCLFYIAKSTVKAKMACKLCLLCYGSKQVPDVPTLGSNAAPLSIGGRSTFAAQKNSSSSACTYMQWPNATNAYRNGLVKCSNELEVCSAFLQFPLLQSRLACQNKYNQYWYVLQPNRPMPPLCRRAMLWIPLSNICATATPTPMA